MAGCLDPTCACIVAGDGTTTSVTGVGTTHAPYVVTAINFGPTGPPGTTGPVGPVGSSPNYFSQAGVVATADRNTVTTTLGMVGAETIFVGFLASAALTVGTVAVYVTQAGTSISTSSAALYTVASNGDLTRVAVSNTNTTWLGTLGRRTITFITPVALVTGNAYVIGIASNIGSTQCNVVASPAINSIVEQGILQPFMIMFNGSSTTSASTTFASMTSGSTLAIPYVELSA